MDLMSKREAWTVYMRKQAVDMIPEIQRGCLNLSRLLAVPRIQLDTYGRRAFAEVRPNHLERTRQ